MKRLRNDERGQSMVIIALAFVALVAFLALVIDGGTVLAARRQMQNAADAAALAGTRKLYALYYGSHTASDEQAIYNAIIQYAQDNGVDDPEDVEAWFIDDSQVHTGANPLPANDGIPADASGVEVSTTTSFPSLFATVIGRDELGASAIAASLLIERPGSGDYAIWADSFDCGLGTLDCTGSDIEVQGNVHSNHGVKVEGSTSDPAIISGAVEYCGTFEPHEDKVILGSVNPWPDVWCDPNSPPAPPWEALDIRVARFAPTGDLAAVAASDPDADCVGTVGGEEQTSCYHYFGGNFKTKTSDDPLPDGLYYVEGNVQINGKDLPAGTVNITIVATGDITMQNVDGKTLTAYSDLTGDGAGDLLLFSSSSPSNPCNHKVIHISTSGTQWNGIILAPYGEAKISAAQAVTAIAGAIWTYRVDLSASLQLVAWNPDHVKPQVAPEVFLFR